MNHPFDRYEPFVDVAALKEISARSLRKSIRVNTLKNTVPAVQALGEAKGWQMTPVPWSPEAFYIDRTDRSVALGRDPLHLLGHIYMQEAASMLPVALLDPKPGQNVFDMSAAPGSKTTYIADRLKGQGMVLANDVQEKRLWTLKTALHRLGTHNVVMTKKVGQWFSKHMTERFDAVLCDAPCTAQGTARKDSDALEFCGLENIEKMSRLQLDLLEAAIHTAKVGARIVYSTCTLTPEENEQVIAAIMAKFPDQLQVLDPVVAGVDFSQAIADSNRVQDWLRANGQFTSPTNYPLLRLWPQTYDTEGFFCAVLQKNAPTRHKEYMDFVRLQEEFIPHARVDDMAESLTETFGTSFLLPGDQLLQRTEHIMLTTEQTIDFRLPVENYAIGVPFCKRLNDGRVRVTNELITLRGHMATKNTHEITADELNQLLDGKDLTCPAALNGDIIVRFQGMNIGRALAKDGKLKNNLSREVIQKS